MFDPLFLDCNKNGAIMLYIQQGTLAQILSIFLYMANWIFT